MKLLGEEKGEKDASLTELQSALLRRRQERKGLEMRGVCKELEDLLKELQRCQGEGEEKERKCEA